jgi:hypothetical protein
MQRRDFIKAGALASSGLVLGSQSTAGGGQSFFSVGKRHGRWCFNHPDGRVFWSIGMNHVDPASLRYEESGGVWETRYHNSMQEWLRQVKRDLTGWGFNTLGWNQEVVTINEQNHRHSRGFTYEEYQWLGMPYCHLLPFIELHQWEMETRLPDIKSPGFAEWCEYVARDQCSRLKDDPKLIGYFYTDCPAFLHNNEHTKWKAPLFDPALLASASGRRELQSLATIYYRVLHDAIRRYDRNHLILGDRYEANHTMAEEIVTAALPYVDVLSFQCFGGPQVVKEKIGKWAEFAGKPVLLADSAMFAEPYDPAFPPAQIRHQDGNGYAAILEVLKSIPQSVGFHLCGAYIRNKVRKLGLKDCQDQVDSPYAENLAKANADMQRWVESL